MTTDLLSKYAALIKVVGLVAVGLIIGLTVNSLRYNVQISDLKASHAAELKRISDAASQQLSDTIKRLAAAEQAIFELDIKHTKELADAKAENNRLRDAVADGTRRLRVAAKCPAHSGGVPEATGAAGLDSDGTVELSAAAGRNVLDIRAGVIEDQSKLLALQEYVKGVCLK